MSDEFDFAKSWLKKFSNHLDDILGEEARKEIMHDYEPISDKSSLKERAEWTQKAIKKLDEIASSKQGKEIMNKCGCILWGKLFEPLKEKFKETGDIDEVLKMKHEIIVQLHERAFKGEINWDVDEQTLELVKNNPLIESGTRKGNKIYIKKVPFASTEYHKTNDQQKKRFYYCHCPNVRGSIELGFDVSPTFCHCGGGYYRIFWENVLGKPVEVEMVKSIIKGDDSCEFIVHLPKNLMNKDIDTK